MPWRWRKRRSLPLFVLEIPYGMYRSVAPGRETLNELLGSGESGGGMWTGIFWEPFELSGAEYEALIGAWQNVDWWKVLRLRRNNFPGVGLILDPEIQGITSHVEYYKRSYEIYESCFWKPRLRASGAE